MRKVLLSSAAICGLALAATPALAQEGGVKLGLGGYFMGYGAFVDQDEVVGREVNKFDLLRNTEIHFTGETTLDNGLTVGAHFEMEADGGVDAMEVEESYLYMSGGWGRVNLGAEDGAAFLLQVAAPSADSNVDGIRQLIQPVNYDIATGNLVGNIQYDYDQNPTGYADKITYLTPVLNGFQAGLSFTPDVGSNGGYATSLAGVREDDEAAAFQEAYELGVRYEGQWNELGFAIGAGYSHINFERDPAPGALDPTDDWKLWNVGVDFDWGPFGLGVAYLRDNNADAVGLDDTETWVVGIDYTTGPFKLGASYYNQEVEVNAAPDLETDRYTGGVVYTYGPGMSFRGSISYIEHDFGANDIDATSILLGTQVNF